MTIKISDSAKNAMEDAFETLLGASPWMRIYDGTVPADESASIGSSNLLAEFQLPADPWANASGGTKTKSGTWSGSAGAGATGARVATYIRLYSNSSGVPGTCHLQCTVATSGADAAIDDDTPTNGQTVTVTSFTLGHDG